MTEFIPERNRLGISFLASVLIHVTFFMLFVFLSKERVRPALPEAKKIMVELFERPAEEEYTSIPEEIERISEESRKVEKELAPKAVQKKILPPLPPPAIEKTVVVPTKAEAMIEAKAEPLLEAEAMETTETVDSLKEETVEDMEERKELPQLSELIPSYDNLTRQVPDFKPQRDVEEGEEISLNTTEFKYLSYFSKLKDRIQMVWRYPEAAKLSGLQGQLVLKFVLNSDGSLRDVRIVESSGIPILDDEAVKAVRRAAPFYAIPENLGDVLSIVANFEYELDYYYVK